MSCCQDNTFYETRIFYFIFSEKHMCSATLPQDVSKISPCRIFRKWSLYRQRTTCEIKTPTKSMPFARLGNGIIAIVERPFLWLHATTWITQVFYNKQISKDYEKLTRRLPSVLKCSDFLSIDDIFQHNNPSHDRNVSF
jgi:hypothetical protein